MSDQAPALDLSKYIEIRLFGERPHVRGRRVPVATIAYSEHDNGWDVARLGYEFTLSQAQVLSALLYYEEHKAEIDAQETAYQAELNQAYRLYGEN
ncbi:MAG TPA: DUF433 domain-containing protein [Phototrophicaceae bacterium]|nr:DUF433 domain-containing protein [Phototrophicaceae bacterium]